MRNTYFIEIKNRFLLTLISWICCVSVSFFYQNNLLYLLIKPCLYKYEQTSFYFVFNNISEPFYTNIQNIFFFSNQITILLICYHTLTFLAPGLYRKEYIKLKYITKLVIFIFIFNIMTFYKIVVPIGLGFFLDYQNSQKINFYFEAKYNEYLKIIFSLYKIIGVVTLLNTIIVYNLSEEKHIKFFLSKYRKIIYTIIILTSAIITPPDIISQVLLSLIFFCIFESIVYVSIQYSNYIFKVTN